MLAFGVIVLPDDMMCGRTCADVSGRERGLLLVFSVPDGKRGVADGLGLTASEGLVEM